MKLYDGMRLMNTQEALQGSVIHHLRYTLGRDWKKASIRDLYWAVSLSVRDRLFERLFETENRYRQGGVKRVYYLSMEFLMGRALGNNLCNLELHDTFKTALEEMGVDLEEVQECTADAALGNGGLGRLAACFLDSMATLGIPGYGYGINYEFGHFRQQFCKGYQRETSDNWLKRGNPWQISRPEEACLVPFFGRIAHTRDKKGDYNPMWRDWEMVVGVPFDMPIVGYGGQTVNTLRLFSAKSSEEFDVEIFNDGDYHEAVKNKISSENISKVLYPSDYFHAGRLLRLVQEYFFVACAIRDIAQTFLRSFDNFDIFPDKVAIQLNDTHPALAIAEFMRYLVDEKALPWERAWSITERTFGYTNHTLLPEALEKWPVSLMEFVVPRHLQIIYEINRRFLEQITLQWPGDEELVRSVSLIEEGEEKQVRMSHLAMVGSHSVNGVAALHTELLKNHLLPDFYRLWPKKFNNKTNGVTPRRWLLKANPGLASLITEVIGDGWIRDLRKLKALEASAEDSEFLKRLMAVKRANKERLAARIWSDAYVRVDPDSLFDVHAKRIHEYKRQLLKALHIVHQYLMITEDDICPEVPRTFVFAGKAAPGYKVAKQIIKLINSIATVVNAHPKARRFLRVAFVPDYRVSVAEKIIPGADLSEQISTAGTEASGTGNMKFAMNGALTVGTCDGANIEIMNEVGRENIFIFGHDVAGIRALREGRDYNPWDIYENDPSVKRILDAFSGNLFCPEDPGLFSWIFEHLLYGRDTYYHLADLSSYLLIQQEVDRCFLDTRKWAGHVVKNIANTGTFSSDRTILEYARDIWGVSPAL
ncbi:glycogen/starch/alpha-glucan phosphorylase [Desulfoluna spongiiphila]|uniref:Alpha-1,4 glucan phosphorylase n=1 Tax=Desulfoluna spongiiphila TaxID=419481 RepID=A0A1G5ES39_9BACT|nr:glycogen/starch/alpha-glucan phosphorylase [Desulfoluna spongiiphila]SCY29787.1 glycogen phosphorylase [Desulfoluna spongiiphila]VVS91305.1 glycogen/starch/alpha-glucan phosphorylase [Desulfoluna spongiiphila]